MFADAPPIEQSAPAPVPSRNVMIWGDKAAMNALRMDFEKRGWRWTAGLLGEQTPVLVLLPPESVSDSEIALLISDINSGKFGKINSGYAMFDVPEPPNEQTVS